MHCFISVPQSSWSPQVGYMYIYIFPLDQFLSNWFPFVAYVFSFLFSTFLPCGLVYTLAARHMMYRSVQYGQYTAQYSTEKTNKNRWEKNKKCKTVWRTWNDLDIYINILTAVPQKFMNSLYVSQILSYSQKKPYSIFQSAIVCMRKVTVAQRKNCSHFVRFWFNQVVAIWTHHRIPAGSKRRWLASWNLFP